MKPRHWQIVFHLHADMSATARIHVDGRLLLPGCDGFPADQALGYIEAALVDCHATDRLALRTQGTAGKIESIRLADPQRAQAWLTERAALLMGALGPDGDTVEDASARSGLRPVLKPGDEHGAPPAAKTSTP
jgi:hypothetical protein